MLQALALPAPERLAVALGPKLGRRTAKAAVILALAANVELPPCLRRRQQMRRDPSRFCSNSLGEVGSEAFEQAGFYGLGAPPLSVTGGSAVEHGCTWN